MLHVFSEVEIIAVRNVTRDLDAVVKNCSTLRLDLYGEARVTRDYD